MPPFIPSSFFMTQGEGPPAYRSSVFLDDGDDSDDGGVSLDTLSIEDPRWNSLSVGELYARRERPIVRLPGNSSTMNAVPSKNKELSKSIVPITSSVLSTRNAPSATELKSGNDDGQGPKPFQTMAGHGSARGSNQTSKNNSGALSGISTRSSTHRPKPSVHKSAELLLPIRQPTTAPIPPDNARSSIGFFARPSPRVIFENARSSVSSDSASTIRASLNNSRSSAGPSSGPAPRSLASTNWRARLDLAPPRQPVQQQPALPPTTTTRGFHPMAALSSGQHSKSVRKATIEDLSAFSDNYLGEWSPQNASASTLSDDENCAVWLMNLPPRVSYHDMLAGIRNAGRIWCCVINRPDMVNHVTAAAKLVFFDPEPARALVHRSLAYGLTIQGHSIKVTHNRVKHSKKPSYGIFSRVLIITGRSYFVNEESLREYFDRYIKYDVDKVVTLIEAEGRTVLEFSFGSFRCQSGAAKRALERNRPDGFEMVEYGQDPCDVGETMSSYGIAGMRIQGMGL